MAKDDSGKNISRTTTNIKSPWLLNAMRSLGLSGASAFEHIMPATSKNASSMMQVSRDVVKELRTRGPIKALRNAINNGEGLKTARKILNNAIEDVRSGNFYNTARSPLDEFDFDAAADGTDFTFDDSASDQTTDTSTQSDATAQQQQIKADRAGFDATLKAIEGQTKNQLQAFKSVNETMISLAGNSLLKTSEIGTETINKLTGIDTTLKSILDFYNTNVSKFIEASIAHYGEVAPKEEEKKDETIRGDSLFDSNGAIDLRRYKDFIKQNIKTQFAGSEIGAIVGSADMLGMLAANPVGMLLGTVVIPAMVPKALKKALEEFDTAVGRFVPVMLERLFDMGSEESGTGLGADIKRTIAKVLGVKTERQTDFDFRDKLQKGPIPYNGLAQQSIVEIIPKYLRESNAYLREIAEHLTGKNREELEVGVEGYDWQNNEFKSMDEMASELYETFMSSITETFKNSDYGKTLSSYSRYFENDKDKENWDEVLNRLYLATEREKGQIKYNDKDAVEALVNTIEASENQRNLIKAAISDMVQGNPALFAGAHIAKIQATKKRTANFRTYENDPTLYNLYQINDKQTIDDYTENVIKGKRTTFRADSNATIVGTGGQGQRTEVTELNVLQDIYHLLDRGIYVVKKRGFDTTVQPSFSGPTTEAEETRSTDSEIDVQSIIEQTQESFYDRIKADREESQAAVDASLDRSADRGGFIESTSATASKRISAVTRVMNGILAGSSDQAFDAMIQGFQETGEKIGNWINQHFLNPIKMALFGEKNEHGYLKGGLFEGIQNRFRESFFSFRRMITGKGYIDAEGNQVADATAEEMQNTVVGQLKGAVKSITTGLKVRLFGEKEERDEEGNITKEGKTGILGRFTGIVAGEGNLFHKGLAGWRRALFGDEGLEGKSDKEIADETLKEMKEKVSEALPTGITGAMAGGLAGGLAGGSILGWLVGGPVGGAFIGFATAIASRSESFKKWLFGEEGEEGRVGGVISKEVQDFVKENKHWLIGGATVGLGLGTAGITGGLLGGLVGGPIGGALMGLATSTILRTKMFQKFLFGDEEKGQRGLVNITKGWFSKIGIAFQGADKSGAKLAGMAALGLGGGLAAGSLLSNVGLLGLTLGPMGPIGGALVGLGAAMLAQKDNFKEWLFGTTDEHGNRKEGIVGQFGNMINVRVFKPMATTIKNIGDDFKTFVEYGLLDKFKLVIEPIGNMVFSGISRFVGQSLGSFKDLATYIKEDFLKGAVEKLGSFLAPVTGFFRTAASAIYGLGKRIVALPIDVMGLLVSPVAQAIGKVTTTVAGTVATAVNWAVIKPIQIGFTLAGKALKGAVAIVSKPFEVIGNVVDTLHVGIQKALHRVSWFFRQVGDDFRNAVTDLYDNTIGRFVGFVKDTATHVKNAVVEGVIQPIKDLAKATIDGIADSIKKSLNNFFGLLLKPFQLIGKAIANLFGIGKSREGGEETPRSGLFGYLRDVWDRTGQKDFKLDFSRRSAEDKSWSQRYAEWKAGYKTEKEKLAERKNERRWRLYNERQIAKYTGNQKVEDTEENRKLAEMMSGKNLSWKNIDPVQTATEQTADNTRTLKDRVNDLYTFFTGKRAPGTQTKHFTKEEKEAQNREHFNLGREAGETAELQFGDASKKSKKKYHNQLSDQVQEEFAQNINDLGLFGGIARNLRLTLSRSAGAFKGVFGRRPRPEETGEETPANARGIFGAKGGLTIVGEEGPEAVYESGAGHGYIVGKHGPEVVDLPRGANVIPNDQFFGKGHKKIPAYAEGTDDEGFSVLTNDAILKTQDETRLGFPNRVIRELLKIRLAAERFVDGFIRNPSFSRFFGKNDQYDEDSDRPDTAEIQLPSLPEGPYGPQVPTAVRKTNEELRAEREKAQEERREESAQLQATVTRKTGEKFREDLEAQALEDEQRTWRQNLLDKLSGVFSINKKFHNLWGSIFGPEGLLTGPLGMILAALAGGLAINVGLDWLTGGGGNDKPQDQQNAEDRLTAHLVARALTKSGVAKAGAKTLGGFVDRTIGAAARRKLGYETEADKARRQEKLKKYGDKAEAKSLRAEKLTQEAEEAKLAAEAAQRNADDAVREAESLLREAEATGSAETRSAYIKAKAEADVAQRNAKKAARDAEKLEKQATKANVKADKAYSKFEQKSMKYGSGAGLVSEEAYAATIADTTAREVTEAEAAELREAAATGRKLASESATIVEEATSSTKAGTLETIINGVKNFFNTIFESSLFKNKPMEKVKEIMAKAIEFIKSNGSRLVAKFAATTAGKAAAAVVTVGLSEAAFITVGAVGGITGAQHLFKTDQEPDGWMVAISGLIGGFTGSLVGTIIDLVAAVIHGATGFDLITTVAELLYAALAGQEAADYLKQTQAEFQNRYATYRLDKVESYYDQLKSIGLMSDQTIENDYNIAVQRGVVNPEEVSLEEYKARKMEDYYGASIMDFSQYNDEQHKDLWAHVGDFFGGVGDIAGKVAGGVGSFLFGREGKKNYIDDQFIYRENDQGNYDVIDKISGRVIQVLEKNIMEKVAEDLNMYADQEGYQGGLFTPVADLLASGASVVGDALGQVGNFVTENSNYIFNAVTGVFQGAISGAKTVVDGVSAAASTAGNAIASIFKSFGDFGGSIIKGLAGMAGDSKAVDSNVSKMDAAIKVQERFADQMNIAAIWNVNPSFDAKGDNFTVLWSTRTFLSKVLNSVVAGTNLLISPFKTVADTIGNFFDGIGKWFKETFGDGSDIDNKAQYTKEEIERINQKYEVSKNTVTTRDYSSTYSSGSESTTKSGSAKGMEGAMGEGPKGGRGGFPLGLNFKVNLPSNILEVLNPPNVTASADIGGKGEAPVTLNGRPYYAQTDSRWGDTPYLESDGYDDGATLDNSGCGPAVMSMVVADVQRNRKIGGRGYQRVISDEPTPLEMAGLAQEMGDRDETGTNSRYMTDAAEAFGIDSARKDKPSGKYIRDAVASGRPVALLGRDSGDGSSPYTDTGHYVFAAGLDSNGKVLINDPKSPRRIAIDPNKLADTTQASWIYGDDLYSDDNILYDAYSGLGEGGLSEGQINILNTALSPSGLRVEPGYCAAYVSDVFEKAGYSGKFKRGNAINMYEENKSYGSSDPSRIPPGAAVYNTGWNTQYGHIGIYMGNGLISESVDGKVKKRDLYGWMKGYDGAYHGGTMTSGKTYSDRPHPGFLGWSLVGGNPTDNPKYDTNTGIDSNYNSTGTVPTVNTTWTRNGDALSQMGGVSNLSSSGATMGGSTTTVTEYTEKQSNNPLQFLSDIFSAVGSALFGGALSSNTDIDWSGIVRDAMYTKTTRTVGSNGTYSGSASSGGTTPETRDTIIEIPAGYGKTHSYMGWQMITARGTKQMDLKDAAENYDAEGFGKVADRYAVAVKPAVGVIGDYLNVEQEGGPTYKAIVADQKGSENGSTGLAKYVHSDGSVVEFVVDKRSWYSRAKGGQADQMHVNPGSSGFHTELAHNIPRIHNVGNFFESPPTYDSSSGSYTTDGSYDATVDRDTGDGSTASKQTADLVGTDGYVTVYWVDSSDNIQYTKYTPSEFDAEVASRYSFGVRYAGEDVLFKVPGQNKILFYGYNEWSNVRSKYDSRAYQHATSTRTEELTSKSAAIAGYNLIPVHYWYDNYNGKNAIEDKWMSQEEFDLTFRNEHIKIGSKSSSDQEPVYDVARKKIIFKTKVEIANIKNQIEEDNKGSQKLLEKSNFLTTGGVRTAADNRGKSSGKFGNGPLIDTSNMVRPRSTSGLYGTNRIINRINSGSSNFIKQARNLGGRGESPTSKLISHAKSKSSMEEKGTNRSKYMRNNRLVNTFGRNIRFNRSQLQERADESRNIVNLRDTYGAIINTAKKSGYTDEETAMAMDASIKSVENRYSEEGGRGALPTISKNYSNLGAYGGLGTEINVKPTTVKVENHMPKSLYKHSDTKRAISDTYGGRGILSTDNIEGKLDQVVSALNAIISNTNNLDALNDIGNKLNDNQSQSISYNTTNNFTNGNNQKVLTTVSGGRGSNSPSMGIRQVSKSETVARKIASGI